MEVKWTGEQLRAIESRGTGVVVPAAAGSGKTAVLIKRTVDLLEDMENRLPAENLMAVTFSRDAAEQIRRKLRTKLAERISEEKDPLVRQWLSQQQERLPLAKISTINAFCLGIVRDNLAEFDYRSGLRICDEIQAAALIDETLPGCFEEYCEQHPERYELLMDAFTDNEEGKLGERVKQLYRFRRSLAFPDKWTEDALKKLGSRAYADSMFARITELIGRKLENALRFTDSLEEQLAQLPVIDGSPMDIPALDRAMLKDLSGVLGTGVYDNIYIAFSTISYAKMAFIREKDLPEDCAEEYRECAEKAKKLRDKMKDQLKSVKELLMSFGGDPYGRMTVTRDIFGALSELAVMLEMTMDVKKSEEGLAEFGDIERKAMELLVRLNSGGDPERTQLAEDMRSSGSCAVMLIDEYQDVNNLEEMIFRAISDTDDLSMLGKNVFVVGDVKQSIYRFRQANPLLFREAIVTARNDDRPGLQEIRLTSNFRSRRNILDFVNMVFVRLMSEEMGEVCYDEGEKLRYGASYIGEDKPVTFLFSETDSAAAESESEDDDSEGEDSLKYVIFGEEELGVARRIKQLFDEGAPVSEGEGTRPCRLSDFCVLTRNNGGCERMSAALDHVGLRAESEQSEGYMGSREIVVMISLLRVIDNRMNDTAMASVMLSPIMSFTAADLAELRLLCFGEGKGQKRHLSQVISSAARGAEDMGISELLTEKCRSAQTFLDSMSFLALSMTLEELINKIYEDTDLFAAASASENPAQRRANLRLFTQFAAEYERDMTGGISGFLRYLDSVSAAGKDFDQAVTVTAGSDAVSVKTFHRSKGLEYPFVFLALLEKRFNVRDTSQPLLMSEKYGAGLSYSEHEKLMSADTLARRGLADIILREQLSEEMRLLYVALTRAKERLFIPITMKHSTNSAYDLPSRVTDLADRIIYSKGITPSLLADCKSPLEWLCCAILTTDMRGFLLEKAGIPEAAQKLARVSPADEAPALMEWELLDTGVSAAEKTDFRRRQPDEATVRGLVEKYAFAFRDDETRAPAKRTVTELVKEIRTRDEGEEKTDTLFFPRIGTLGEGTERLSAALKGTYTHLFMQLADYPNAEKDAEAELRRLTEAGRFTEREASGVYIDAVKRFFRSELYERMKRSGDIKRELQFMVKASDAGLDEKYGDMISPDGMLQGVCDCVFTEDDGYVLVDYKTDNFGSADELDKYAVQLELYKAALDLILPKPVKACCIYSFKLGVTRTVAL